MNMKLHKRLTPPSRRGGFTLIEIMAVITIIGIIAGVFAWNVMGSVESAEIEMTQTQIQQTANAIERYRMQTGAYPESLEDLVRPPSDMDEREWGGPYIDNIPEDAWGNELIYERNNGRNFEVMSYGANGSPGGEGPNATISNRENGNDS